MNASQPGWRASPVQPYRASPASELSHFHVITIEAGQPGIRAVCWRRACTQGKEIQTRWRSKDKLLKTTRKDAYSAIKSWIYHVETNIYFSRAFFAGPLAGLGTEPALHVIAWQKLSRLPSQLGYRASPPPCNQGLILPFATLVTHCLEHRKPGVHYRSLRIININALRR